jgi:hypothetical protein
MNFWKNSVGSADNEPVEIEAAVTASKPEPVERGILRDVAAQRDSARQRVTDGELKLARLAGIIENGERASSVLQAKIDDDGAASLQAIVSGDSAPDASMMTVVMAEVSARAAREALPNAQAALAEAKAVRERAEVEVMRAARNLLLTEATARGDEYRAAFATLARLHDELLGISGGIPPMEKLGQEIANSVVGFEIPNFNLGRLSYAVKMKHTPDSAGVAKTTARWNRAREALYADPDCDFLAVLDQPAEPLAATGSGPPGMTMGINPAADAVHGPGVPIGSGVTADFIDTAAQTLRF